MGDRILVSNQSFVSVMHRLLTTTPFPIPYSLQWFVVKIIWEDCYEKAKFGFVVAAMRLLFVMREEGSLFQDSDVQRGA